MIVYACQPDYVTSTWLKNEWTRYNKLVELGNKKNGSLLVVCDGFSPSNLPKLLASKQCFDATKRSFYCQCSGIKMFKSDISELIFFNRLFLFSTVYRYFSKTKLRHI